MIVGSVTRRLRRLQLVPEPMVTRMCGAMGAAAAGQSPLGWCVRFGPMPAAKALAWAYTTTWLVADLLDYLGEERGQRDRFSDCRDGSRSGASQPTGRPPVGNPSLGCSGFRHGLARLDRGADWREREEVEEGGDRRAIIELAPIKQVADCAEGYPRHPGCLGGVGRGPFKVALSAWWRWKRASLIPTSAP